MEEDEIFVVFVVVLVVKIKFALVMNQTISCDQTNQTFTECLSAIYVLRGSERQINYVTMVLKCGKSCQINNFCF